MYDIFFVSKNSIDDSDWKSFHEKYPLSIKLENVKAIDEIKQKAFTKMFWLVWDDLILDDDFDLKEYRATKWDDMYVHVFKNGESYDGICLIPRQLEISKKEFDHRFFTEKKEIDIIVSNSKPFEQFNISDYREYLACIEKATSNMFWAIWNDVELISDLDYQVPYHNQHITHVFRNGEYFDGVCLLAKSKKISEKEFKHRFFTEKKEIDIRISKPKQYDKFFLKTYDEYLYALEKSTTEMFWVVWSEVEIIDDSVFDLYFDHHSVYDRSENHLFKNLCNSESSYYNGIVLFSKNKPISKKEFDRRYIINKKEHDKNVSRSRYPRYEIDSYRDYLDILDRESQALFWCVWPEIEITDNSIFDLYFDPRDGKYDHDRKENHVFKHLFRGEETFFNGAVLFSTNKKIGKREFDHRFLIERKEHDQLSSKFKPYDIVFISYNEPNADENYSRILEKFPTTKRVDKVKGIHQAHIRAAEISQTEMFWVVDGDAVIVEDFNFDHETSTYERDIVHVWRSKNPINDLIYGYGGVKLLPRKLTLEMDIDTPDMTTAISKKFKAMPSVSNITAFDTDPFNTWKSAFRECVKLSSRLIDRQDEKETKERLDVWCSVGRKTAFGEYAIKGAVAGRCYGEENKNDREKLKLINDFTWLKAKFDEI